MSTKAFVASAALLAMTVTGCASVPDLTTTRTVSKRDMDACSHVADKAVNEPNRLNNQTAVAVGSTIGAGLVGLAVAAAANSHDDQVTGAKARNDFLARRGYKLVPKKTDS